MSTIPLAEMFSSLVHNRKVYLSEFYGSSLPIIEPPKDVASAVDDNSSFLESNKTYWETILDPTSAQNTSGVLLVDLTFEWRPGIHVVCTLANYIAMKQKLKPVYLVDGEDYEKMAICKSYYNSSFISMTPASYSNRAVTKAAVTVSRHYPNMKEPKDLFDLSLGNIPIGDLVYGTIMRKSGDGTITDLDSTCYKYLLSSVLRYNHLREVFNQLDVTAAISTHIGYIQGGLIARMTVANDGDVYVPKGDYRVLRKFESMEEINWEVTRPSHQLFREIIENHRQRAIQQADKFLEDRFGVSPESSFNSDEKHREQLLSDYDPLSDSNPTVLVLPHIFIERLRNDGRLFQDYLTWFRETVQFASRIPEVNWLVKPHPGRHKYQDDMEQDVHSEVNEILDDRRDHSVAIIPEDTPREVLVSSVDAITTMDGTAGVEYPCYGIPVVLASESPYSGFGFTHKPKSKEEYFELLESIDKVPKLTEKEIERAKIMCYIHFILIRDQWPAFPEEADSKWENAMSFLNQVRNSNLDQNIAAFIENNRKHLIDQSIGETFDER